MAFQNRTIDTLLAVWDGGAVAADGYTQVSSATATIDLGGDTVKGTATTARMWAALELLPSVINTADGDESYVISVMGSNSSTFANTIVPLAHLFLGDKDAANMVPAPSADLTGLSRYLVPFCNERDGVIYRYIRVHVNGTGTSFTITAKAWLTKLSDYPAM